MRDGSTANVGDLVILDGDSPISGVVLEINYWFNEIELVHERDLYVYWANGERYWCLGRGGQIFRKTIK